MPIQIVVRILRTKEDLVAADALYREQSGDYLPIPDPDDTWASICDDAVFGAFDNEGQMLAVGGTYLVARALSEGGKIVAIYEMAGLIVHREARRMMPYGLQDILVAVRVAALVAQGSTEVCLITSIAGGNSGSRSSMTRCGLEAIPEGEVPVWLRDVRRTWRAGSAPDVIDHIVLPSAVPYLLKILGTVSTDVLTRTPEGGNAIEYAVSISEPVDLHLVLQRDDPLKGWARQVPRQRMIGREPPFFRWGRI